MVAVQIGASEELVQRPSPVSNGIAIPYPRGSDGTRRIQMRTALIAGIALSIATSPTAAKDKFGNSGTPYSINLTSSPRRSGGLTAAAVLVE